MLLAAYCQVGFAVVVNSQVEADAVAYFQVAYDVVPVLIVVAVHVVLAGPVAVVVIVAIVVEAVEFVGTAKALPVVHFQHSAKRQPSGLLNSKFFFLKFW